MLTVSAQFLKAGTGEKLCADGQHQSGDADCKQQEKRKDVVRKGLDCELAPVTHPELHRQDQPHEQEDGGDIQQVEVQEASQAVNGKLFNDKTHEEHTVDFRIARSRLEVNPSKDQRECHGERDRKSVV